MVSVPVTDLLSTLPARGLLGRLLAIRVAVIAGWIVGMLWLHAGLGIRLPLVPMAAVLALMTLFALLTGWRLKLDAAVTQSEFLAQLLADLTAFAVLVFFSGGVTNPFVSLMLVPVVVAAVSLRPAWVWLLAGVAGGYYGLLLFVYQPLAVADPVAAYGMHLAGMWLNFLISAALIAVFVTRMHAALRARDRALADLREKQLRDERIVALGTQAALAAHELATPLATIQTTAHELAGEFANDPDIGADCRLLEKQAQACKQILDRLAARARDGVEPAQALDVWLQGVVERWQVVRPDASVMLNLADASPFAPPEGLEQALVNLLNNAADAAPSTVEVRVEPAGTELVIEVADRGPGFSADQHTRAGLARFAGKPGRGWGMGLALTHATVERAGGRVSVAPRDGGGTLVRIHLPRGPAA